MPRTRTHTQTFDYLREARRWAYRELDTSQGIFFLVFEKDLQGNDIYYFVNQDEYNTHTALWETDLDIVEVWE